MARLTKQIELAEHYGASLKTVYQWTRRAGWPGGKAGPWLTGKTDALLESIGSPFAPSRKGDKKRPGRVSKGAQKAAAGALRKAEAETDLRIEQHRAAKLTNDAKAGLLWDRADAVREIAELAVRIKGRIESLPEIVSPMIPPAIRQEVVAEIAEQIRLVLAEVASWRIEAGSLDVEGAILEAADRIRQDRKGRA